VPPFTPLSGQGRAERAGRAKNGLVAVAPTLAATGQLLWRARLACHRQRAGVRSEGLGVTAATAGRTTLWEGREEEAWCQWLAHVCLLEQLRCPQHGSKGVGSSIWVGTPTQCMPVGILQGIRGMCLEYAFCKRHIQAYAGTLRHLQGHIEAYAGQVGEHQCDDGRWCTAAS
jgi:hypothetical protein